MALRKFFTCDHAMVERDSAASKRTFQKLFSLIYYPLRANNTKVIQRLPLQSHLSNTYKKNFLEDFSFVVKVLGLGAGKRFGCLFKLATTFKSYLPAYKCYVTIYGSLTKGRCVILLKAIKASHMQLYSNIWRGKGALTWILICRMSRNRAYFMLKSFDMNIKSRCIFFI